MSDGRERGVTELAGMFGGRENGREEVPFEEYDVKLFELGEAAERQFLEEGRMTSVFADEGAAGQSLINSRLKAALNKDMNAETAAKATFEVLKTLAGEIGQKPDVEVGIFEPGKCGYFDNRDCWVVAWEAGPYEWGIAGSFAAMDATGKLVEPYYSFDLCFYPSEDK